MKCSICGSEWHESDNCPKKEDVDVIELPEDFEGFRTNPTIPETTNQNTTKKHYFAAQ